jgi:membrane-bound lytic murein transglycosylase D
MPCYYPPVKKVCLFALLLGLVPAVAQDDTIDVGDLMQSADEWASNNFDDDVLRAIHDNVDREKVRKFLADAQKDFQGQYVIDLAQLRDAANAVLPILESSADTQPYALWLKARLDYLDVADEYRLTIPKSVPGKPPQPVPNPKPQQIREIWISKISKRVEPKETNPLVSQLKPIFATENVPPQLVWIAQVESSFDSRARSPAGAVGMFQLMPATAKRFGLRTWPFDQRTDIEHSARASAKYLRALHEKFSDWRLALAAYNAGEGTVQKLLDRHKTKTFDAIAPQLPAETQLFVPKVEAVILRAEGIKLQSLPARVSSNDDKLKTT